MTNSIQKRLALALAGSATLAAASLGLVTSPSVGAARPTCAGHVATIVGNAGSNEIHGTAARDVIVGRAGNDDIEGRGGGDIICGNRGNDDIEGNRGNDRLYGNRGNDELEGNRGDDRLFGGRGFDEAEGGPGSDVCRAEERESC